MQIIKWILIVLLVGGAWYLLSGDQEPLSNSLFENQAEFNAGFEG